MVLFFLLYLLSVLRTICNRTTKQSAQLSCTNMQFAKSSEIPKLKINIRHLAYTHTPN